MGGKNGIGGRRGEVLGRWGRTDNDRKVCCDRSGGVTVRKGEAWG